MTSQQKRGRPKAGTLCYTGPLQQAGHLARFLQHTQLSWKAGAASVGARLLIWQRVPWYRHDDSRNEMSRIHRKVRRVTRNLPTSFRWLWARAQTAMSAWLAIAVMMGPWAGT